MAGEMLGRLLVDTRRTNKRKRAGRDVILEFLFDVDKATRESTCSPTPPTNSLGFHIRLKGGRRRERERDAPLLNKSENTILSFSWAL